MVNIFLNIYYSPHSTQFFWLFQCFDGQRYLCFIPKNHQISGFVSLLYLYGKWLPHPANGGVVWEFFWQIFYKNTSISTIVVVLFYSVA
jgi:hypothetical protein